MDERLQALRREVAATGDPEAEAALLRHRVGLGLLSPKRLRLAAYLGHPPAVRIHAEYLRPDHQPLTKWVRGLGHFGGPEGWARLLVALAEEAIARADEPAHADRRARFPQGLSHAERLVSGARAVLGLPVAGAALERALHALEGALATFGQAIGPAWAILRLGGDEALIASHAARAALAVAGAAPAWHPSLGANALRQAEALLGAPRARRAIQAALLPWALAEEGPA